METRTCSTCKQDLPLDHFSPDKTRGGLQRQCRPCRAAYMRGYNAKNRDRVNLRVTLSNWGITEEQYDQLVTAQAGLCALCSKPPRRSKSLCLDHDHETGKVRGLLCQDCNLGLGQLRDDPALLRRGADYIEAGGVLSPKLQFSVDPLKHGQRRTDIRRRARLDRT